MALGLQYFNTVRAGIHEYLFTFSLIFMLIDLTGIEMIIGGFSFPGFRLRILRVLLKDAVRVQQYD